MYVTPVCLHLLIERFGEDTSLTESCCNHQTLLQTVKHIPQQQEPAETGTNWERLENRPDEREISIVWIDHTSTRHCDSTQLVCRVNTGIDMLCIIYMDLC